MRAIVLVKQVPDLRLGGVGVHPDGTIDRAAAPPITNPADLHALAAAVQLADEVVALSMGPPLAEQALRDAIAAGAHRAVLLCDHAFAGSDTWATANALAAAVRVVGGADLVLCGISALDGETGQVGPSVAQRLGWPQATGCEALELEGMTLVARRVVEGGYERLRMPLPAVATVGETGFTPGYPTLPRRRAAAAATIERLTAADLGLSDHDVGLAASPTKVARMSAAPWPDRGCRFVGVDGFGYQQLVAELVARGSFAPGDPVPSPTAAQPAAPAARSAVALDAVGSANVWVVCQLVDGAPDRASLELLTKATELAPALGGGVAAVVLAADPGNSALVAAAHGADIVYVAVDPALAQYRAEPFAAVLAAAARQYHPQAILLTATTTGRDLAPRVASLLNTGLAADCTDLYVGSWTRQGVTHNGLLHMVRPAMAGGVLATCLCPEVRPQMATVRPGVFEPCVQPRRGLVVPLAVSLHDDDLRVEVLERRISPADVDLRDADVVIAGGAGCDAASWHLVEQLAAAIGGSVAASRGAVEAGLAQRSLQVGQTGATVRPRLYVACGISGALQHAVGMQDSGTIVAINRNPDAVVFKLAHFGIVADVADAVPRLIAALGG
ncbi:MAG: FAD-binding protein [Actinomycetota bacterium]|nr:FAD-binding protein [Actinomycetota bacterium]